MHKFVKSKLPSKIYNEPRQRLSLDLVADEVEKFKITKQIFNIPKDVDLFRRMCSLTHLIALKLADGYSLTMTKKNETTIHIPPEFFL